MKYELINADEAPSPSGRGLRVVTAWVAPSTISKKTSYTQIDLEQARLEMNSARAGKSKRTIKKATQHFNEVWQYLRENAE